VCIRSKILLINDFGMDTHVRAYLHGSQSFVSIRIIRVKKQKMKPKKIILGITGSIAAYKIATLTRLLIKSGAEVQCLMTESATQFITPLTLSTLSKRPVLTEIMSENGWNNHVELGLWADAMIIAPCTATTMAKLANGLCDNIVTAVYLSARCPIFFAPAMDLDMWKHPACLLYTSDAADDTR
jgi:phosphopantothenoylcysteine decarboxylase/phosphopantothenate--cysteine ligase